MLEHFFLDSDISKPLSRYTFMEHKNGKFKLNFVCYLKGGGPNSKSPLVYEGISIEIHT